MPKISISFDPKADTQASIIAMVAAIYGTSVAGAQAAAVAMISGALEHTDDEPGNDAPAGTTVDSTGLPWDARIHSTPAKLTAKGEWRSKRGADPQLVAKVEAELRAAQPAAQTPANAGVPVTAPTTPVAVAPAGMAAPQFAIPKPPAPAAAPTPYENLVKLIGENLYSPANPTGRLNNDWVQAALTQFNVPGGLLQNAATMDPATVQSIVDGITQALAQ